MVLNKANRQINISALNFVIFILTEDKIFKFLVIKKKKKKVFSKH